MLDKAMTYLGRVVVDEVEKIKEAEKKGNAYGIRDYSALQYLYICALGDRQLTSAERSAADICSDILRQRTLHLTFTARLSWLLYCQRTARASSQVNT